jgi:hypothetical protein
MELVIVLQGKLKIPPPISVSAEHNRERLCHISWYRRSG